MNGSSSALSLSTLASTASAYAAPNESQAADVPFFSAVAVPAFQTFSAPPQMAPQQDFMSTSDFLLAMQRRADLLAAAHKVMSTQTLTLPPGNRQYLTTFNLVQPQNPQTTSTAIFDNALLLQQPLRTAPFQPVYQVFNTAKSDRSPMRLQQFRTQSTSTPSAMDLLSALTNYSAAIVDTEQAAAAAAAATAAADSTSSTESAQTRTTSESGQANSSSLVVAGKKRGRSRSIGEDGLSRVMTPQKIAELGAPFQKASIGQYDKDTPYRFPHDPMVTLAAEFRYFLSEYMQSIDSAEEELMTRRFDSRDDAEEALHFTLTHLAPCLCSVMYGTLHRKGGTFYRYLCPTATKRKHTQPGARGCPVGRITDAAQDAASGDKILNRPCSFALNNPEALQKAVTSRSQNECHWVAILAICPDDPSKFYFKRIDSVSRHCALCIARRSSRVKRVIMKKIGELCSGVSDGSQVHAAKKANVPPPAAAETKQSDSAAVPSEPAKDSA